MEFSNIINRIETIQERDTMIRATSELSGALYKTDEKQFDLVVSKFVPYQLADELHRSLPEDREEKTIFLDALRRVLEKMEVVTVMVAFHPTENFMKELLEKIREVLTLNVVVRIVVSRLLLGGARVEYKGRIVDLSIRSKLTKILEEHQSELGDWGVGN